MEEGRWNLWPNALFWMMSFERLPVANGACLFRQVERAWSRRFQRSGAGFKNVVGAARTRQGRKSSTSFLIVDAQSVKNTDSAREKGYDAGKKVSGIKRHIAVDTQGLPHAIAVTTADVTDRKGALRALHRCATDLRAVQSILADGGYVGQPFAQAVEKLIGAQVQIAKRSELHTFAVMPQRWVVERFFA